MLITEDLIELFEDARRSGISIEFKGQFIRLRKGSVESPLMDTNKDHAQVIENCIHKFIANNSND
jgi:hypothetical protein